MIKKIDNNTIEISKTTQVKENSTIEMLKIKREQKVGLIERLQTEIEEIDSQITGAKALGVVDREEVQQLEALTITK